MKILHLISSSGYYGADSMLIQLAKGSMDSLLSPVIGVFRNVHNPHLEIAEVARGQGIPVEVLLCRGRVDIATVRKIRRILTRRGIDVVHTHGYKSNLYAWGSTVGTQVGRIATCHNWLGNDVKMRSYARLDKLFLKRFDRVVAVSDTIREELVSARIPPEKIVTVYNGIDLNRFQREVDTKRIRKELGIREGFRVVGTVGRLSEEKGHIYFVRAASDPSLKEENLVFLIVGDGPLKAVLEQEAGRKKGAGPEILFAGKRSDVERIYRVMDLFVLPSLTEGLPMALLEAVASRRPVVATRVGGVPQVLADGTSGSLVEPGDATALAKAIQGLLADPEGGSRMAEKAYEAVRGSFSADRMTKRYFDLYANLMSSRRRRSGEDGERSLFGRAGDG